MKNGLACQRVGTRISSQSRIFSDGATLNPIPDGQGGVNPAGRYSIGVLGLGFDGGGNIIGTPQVAGVYWISTEITDTNVGTGTSPDPTLHGWGIVRLRIEHIDIGEPIITSPNVAVGQLDTPF